MFVHVSNGKIDPHEQLAYLERGREKYGDELAGIDLKLDGEDVEITYTLKKRPFERVRRITGYLVGTMDRWNNAKQAEERDRVKHEI